MRALAVMLTVVAACSPAGPSSFELSGPHDFGVVPAGQTRRLDVDVVNTGRTTVTLLGGESDDPDFTAPFDGYVTVAPQAHAQIAVLFVSKSAHLTEHNATLTVLAAGGLEATTTLEAVSAFAECPPSLRGADFRAVAIGDTGHQAVTIVNESSIERPFTVGPLVGQDSSAFTVPTSHGRTLLPGQDIAIEVTFTPDAGREYRAQFAVTFGDCPPSGVDVTGTGMRAVLDCRRDPMFPYIPPGVTATGGMVVINYSANPVQLWPLDAGPRGELSLGDAGVPWVVPPALPFAGQFQRPGQMWQRLVFSPAELGLRPGTFTAGTSLAFAPLLTCEIPLWAGGSNIEVPERIELPADGGAGSLTIRNVTPDPMGVLRLHRITSTGASTLSIGGYYQGMEVQPGASAELMLSVTQPGTWELQINSNTQHEQHIDIAVVAR